MYPHIIFLRFYANNLHYTTSQVLICNYMWNRNALFRLCTQGTSNTILIKYFSRQQKAGRQNDLIHVVQLGGTVAVTLTRTLPELSPVQAFSCTWMQRESGTWMIKAASGAWCLLWGWSVSSLSWNWHAFYMLCDPVLMFHEQQPVFHVQVSAAGITHRGSCCRLTAGCCCWFGVFFNDESAPFRFMGPGGSSHRSMQWPPDPSMFTLQRDYFHTVQSTNLLNMQV